MNTKLSALLLLALACALLLSACGGGDNKTPTVAPTLAPTLTPTAAYNNVVTYAYDDAGRLIQAEYADGTIIEYTYDKAGNLIGQEVIKR